MSKTFLPDCELRTLDCLAHVVIIYLVVVSLSAFFVGVYILNSVPNLPIISTILIGFCGSAIAALTSCLERYANGFERENGQKFPKEEPKDKFNRRFARGLVVRPFLGAVVAPVFIWGLSHFTKNPLEFQSPSETLGFTAFMGGLLAKSVLELVKNLFKNVFKA
ncbi:MAG: hypothetical protein U1E38_05400 [Rhodospirillales bacterium]